MVEHQSFARLFVFVMSSAASPKPNKAMDKEAQCTSGSEAEVAHVSARSGLRPFFN
jgi:hypothetical protein